MCGFLGEVSDSLISEGSFIDLLCLSSRRGPDGQAFWSYDQRCRLGFNRLSILDLSYKGMQPIHSPSGRFVLMINGEIYNYRELQQKYGIKESVLRSGSDAEILSQILDVKSTTSLLSELDGMFAITVFDREKETITLARDFAGIKPLFYGTRTNAIVFASQFNQVFRHPIFRINLQLRPQIVKEYMGLGYMQAPNTVFRDIYQVLPGEFLVYDIKQHRIVEKSFYFHWKEQGIYKESNTYLPEAFNNLFSNVVKSQLQSDVRLAVFLSGGIDSPLVAAHAKSSRFDLCAYTLKVDDIKYNESDVAARYAERIGIRHELLHISENDLVNRVNEHFKGIPEPFGDYSSIPTWAICNKARDHATVMLSGDGGDELFWGYPRFNRSVQNLQWFNFPRWFRKTAMPINRVFNHTLSYGPMVYDTFGEWILHKQIHLSELDAIFPEITFSNELLNVYNYNGSNVQDALLFLKRNEFYAHMQRVLRKVDIMSMANSMEVRVPFLSKDVISFSNDIIPELGINNNIPKIILKKALEKFIPKDTIHNEKRGFTVPIEQWMHGSLKQDIKTTLLHQHLYGAEILDLPFLQSLVRDFFSGESINPWGIWQIYAWQKWAIENNLN